MKSEQIILKVPRAKTEALFLHRVIQAAIQAYRNEGGTENVRIPDTKLPRVA